MKRLLTVLPVVAVLGLADTYVLPTRLDLGVLDPTYSLQQDTYTNSTTWLTGHLNGNAMTDFSPERTDAVIESPCVVFDGVGDYVDVGLIPTENIMVKFRARITDVSSLNYLFGQATTGNRAYIFNYASGNFGVSGKKYAFDTGVSADTNWHIFEYDLQNGAFKIDDSADLLTSDDDFSGLNASYSAFFGARNDSSILYGNCEFEWFEWYENDVLIQKVVFTESSGTTLYDVSGNGTHATATITSSESEFWGGTQTNSPYFAENGGLTFSDGTNTVYVPQLSDGSAPATNSISGYSITHTNGTGYAHNAGPYSLIFGGATNSYANLLTNGTAIVEDGMITEYYK